jgi:hypothetical protein
MPNPLYNKFVNKSSEIVLNVDGTRTERKARLSNIDVHETISENVNNNNSDNQLKSIKIDNNVNSKSKYDNYELDKLRKSILDMINDITAFNMHDIMRPTDRGNNHTYNQR